LRRTKVELEAALLNSREARQVVFDLFQDLEGFSLDDYKPFSDVSEGMDRLVRFLSAAVAERGDKIVRKDEARFDLMGADESLKACFTRNREEAASDEKLELLGLDHPIMEEALWRARGLSPEGLGIVVDGGEGNPILMSCWMVEASSGSGERKAVVQVIAVREDGTRLPAIERQADRYFGLSAGAPALSPERRVELFREVVEPCLQRELRHKGAANGDGSYSVEMIGYAEIV
jgi:hypothetical protein